MSYLPSSPNLASLAGLLAKYPRCGVLLFKLLENNKSACSALSEDVYDVKVPAKELGGDETILRQLRRDIDSAHIDEKFKPLLHFVKKLTLTPSQITKVDIEQIYAAGWDERALLDTVRLCAVVNCMNGFVLGVGIGKTAHNQRPSFILNQPRIIYHS